MSRTSESEAEPLVQVLCEPDRAQAPKFHISYSACEIINIRFAQFRQEYSISTVAKTNNNGGFCWHRQLQNLQRDSPRRCKHAERIEWMSVLDYCLGIFAPAWGQNIGYMGKCRRHSVLFICDLFSFPNGKIQFPPCLGSACTWCDTCLWNV
jgi:hypothetical protein